MLAEANLSKGDAIQKRTAVDYLVKANKPEALAKHWKYNDGFVRPAVRRAGFEIDIKNEAVSFKPIHRQHRYSWTISMIGFGLVFLLLVTGWVGYRRLKA